MRKHRNVLGVGVIGCGKVALEHHLPSLKKVAGARLAAVADIDPQRVEAAKRNNLSARYFSTAGELLADQSVDVVAVLVPTPNHHEIGMAALLAGKHVFMEKPLALSRSQCDQLVEAGKQSGKKSMTCFNLRWHRLVQMAENMIATGLLGTIKAINSTYTHCRDPQHAQPWHRYLKFGGGVSFNECVHHFDLWYHLLRSDVEEVFAFHRATQDYEDESSMVVARLKNGILASCFNTFRTSPTNEIEIVGSSGRLCINLYRYDGLQFFPAAAYPGSILLRIKHAAASLRGFSRAIGAVNRGGAFAETFHYAWSHFIRCIQEDKDPNCSLVDGRRAVLTALAAVQSFSSGRPAGVEEDNRLPC